MNAAVDPNAVETASTPVVLTDGSDVADLWSQTRHRLHRFLARRAPAGVDVDDLLQDVFLRLHKSRDRLGEVEQIDAWLYRIARNVLIDRIRALNARPEIPMPNRLDLPDLPMDPSDTGALDARTELSACIRPLLESLPDKQRIAIELTDLGHMTQRQAADQEGVSVSGLKSRVQRGRRKMRADLTSCCAIELDARGGVINHEPRRPRCDNC